MLFFCWGWSNLDKISQTDAEWHVDCGDVVEIETRCRIRILIWRTFGRIQWHVIPEPHITLHGDCVAVEAAKAVLIRYPWRDDWWHLGRKRTAASIQARAIGQLGLLTWMRSCENVHLVLVTIKVMHPGKLVCRHPQLVNPGNEWVWTLPYLILVLLSRTNIYWHSWIIFTAWCIVYA